MIRSVLSRPVRLVQHAALGAAHVGLNSVASVLSKVTPGSQDASGGTQDTGASSGKAAPPVDRGGDSRATPPPATKAPASAKKPQAAKKPEPAKKPEAAKKPEPAKKPEAAKKPTAKKSPAKKSPAKKAPAKKSPAKKAAANVTPADVAARTTGPADDKEHVEVEEVLAYSTGPDVTTTVGDEVSDSSTS